LAILFRPIGFIDVPDDGYSRNSSCMLNLISMFLCPNAMCRRHDFVFCLEVLIDDRLV
jgi:hypothetical protein